MKEKSFYTWSICAPAYQLLQHYATNSLVLWSKLSFKFEFLFSVQLKNFLSEFANEDLINLGRKFGIAIKTGKSPWSNGVVEKHNSKPSSMLDKVLINGKCDFDLALNWCKNAKNCLANNHGFTLYQLGIGINSRPASALHNIPPVLTVETTTQTIADNTSSQSKKDIYSSQTLWKIAL